MRIFEFLCRPKSDPWRKRLAVFLQENVSRVQVKQLPLKIREGTLHLGHKGEWTSQQECLEEGK